MGRGSHQKLCNAQNKGSFCGTSSRRHDLLIVTTTCNKISKIVKISNGQLVTRTFLGEDWLHCEQLAASDIFSFCSQAWMYCCCRSPMSFLASGLNLWTYQDFCTAFLVHTNYHIPANSRFSSRRINKQRVQYNFSIDSQINFAN